MRDEGLGPRIAEELINSYELPPQVEVLDRGVMGMALLSDLREAEEVLVIDAVDHTGYPAGTVLRYYPKDMVYSQVFRGAHDTRLIDVLQAADMLGYPVHCECLGVQAADINPPQYAIGLTSEVEAALPKLLSGVEHYLTEHGIPWQRKA